MQPVPVLTILQLLPQKYYKSVTYSSNICSILMFFLKLLDEKNTFSEK